MAHIPQSRLFTERQARENDAFLKLLRQSGNASAAAREIGIPAKTFHSRRTKNAAFAAEWEAALVEAQVALAKGGGGNRGSLRVQKGVGGRLQMRRPRAGTMDRAAEQVFLRALAATCNVSLAATAAGFNPKNIHRRRKDKVFAAEWDLALKIGHDRLLLAAEERLDQAKGEGGAERAWLDEGEDQLPEPTMAEILQLLKLHQRAVILGSEHRAERRIARRVGQLGRMGIDEIASIRQAAAERARAEREEAARIQARLAKRAEAYEVGGNWFLPGELPKGLDLTNVSGWSKAQGKGVRAFTAKDAEEGRRVKAKRK